MSSFSLEQLRFSEIVAVHRGDESVSIAKQPMQINFSLPDQLSTELVGSLTYEAKSPDDTPEDEEMHFRLTIEFVGTLTEDSFPDGEYDFENPQVIEIMASILAAVHGHAVSLSRVITPHMGNARFALPARLPPIFTP